MNTQRVLLWQRANWSYAGTDIALQGNAPWRLRACESHSDQAHLWPPQTTGLQATHPPIDPELAWGAPQTSGLLSSIEGSSAEVAHGVACKSVHPGITGITKRRAFRFPHRCQVPSSCSREHETLLTWWSIAEV